VRDRAELRGARVAEGGELRLLDGVEQIEADVDVAAAGGVIWPMTIASAPRPR
jgi:hypothetical protein